MIKQELSHQFNSVAIMCVGYGSFYRGGNLLNRCPELCRLTYVYNVSCWHKGIQGVVKIRLQLAGDTLDFVQVLKHSAW